MFLRFPCTSYWVLWEVTFVLPPYCLPCRWHMSPQGFCFLRTPFPVLLWCLYVTGLEYCSSRTSPPSLWTSGRGTDGGRRRACLGKSFCSDSSFVFQTLSYLHLEESSHTSNTLGLVSALGVMPGNSVCLVQLDTTHTWRSGMFCNNLMPT